MMKKKKKIQNSKLCLSVYVWNFSTPLKRTIGRKMRQRFLEKNKEVEDKIENSRLTGNERKMELH